MLYNQMSLAEKIGQLFMVGFDGTIPNAEIIDLIQRRHVGGVILFSRNIESAEQVRRLTSSLQQIAREAGHRAPLLISIDQENGMVQRFGHNTTLFPGNMALGAIGDEQVVYEVAKATGQELRALGVNMNLAPVVDVNNNPANPVIGVRSFGEEPAEVARLTAAAVRGYEEAGIVSCLKHFPGHGDTNVDSHLALPTIPYTLERLTQVELAPFRSGISAGASSIMSAHIYFPALMGDEPLPATVSPAVIRGLLREQAGYNGVVVSDCLEMHAIGGTVGVGKGSVMTLQAGIDIVLISHRYARQEAGIEAVEQALRSGELSEQALEQAVERVMTLKEHKLSWDEATSTEIASVVGSAEHRHLQQQAYELSTTLVRNDEGLIPLRLQEEQQLLIVFPERGFFSPVEIRGYSVEFLIESLQQRHQRVDALVAQVSPDEQERQRLQQIASAADLILVISMNAFLDQKQAQLMQSVIQAGKPVIGLATYNPYDLLAFPQLKTYLVTYEYTRAALEAAVRVLFGEIIAQGRLPVTLPGFYPRGHKAV